MRKKKIENCRDKAGFINLNKLESYKERGQVVEGTHAKQWYNVDKCRFLFKEYNDVLPAFGEVLYSKIARSCGVKCAKYDFGVCNGKVGTISYDFLGEGKVYYNFLELTTQFVDTKFSLNDIRNNRELLVLHNNKYNNLISIGNLLENLFSVSEEEKKNIEIELIKRFCLDTVFWHGDRNLWNFGVIVDEVSDEMSLDFAHDNSHVLCLEKGEKYIESMIFSLINGEKFSNLDVSDSLFRLDFDGDDSMEQLIKFYGESDNNTRGIIENLISEIDPEKEVEELYDVCKIGDVPKLWIKAVLNYRKITILKGIESVRIDDEEAKKPNFTFSKRK